VKTTFQEVKEETSL